jgi:nitroreductase
VDIRWIPFPDSQIPDNPGLPVADPIEASHPSDRDMMTTSPEQLLGALNWRYATKKFKASTPIRLDQAHVDHFLARQIEVRGGSLEALAGYRGMMLGSLQKATDAGYLDVWQTHQLYIALGQFMTAAALLGVDTCPMEGIVPVEYDRILGLTGSGYKTVVACAAGYRADDDKYASQQKVRFPASEVVKHI